VTPKLEISGDLDAWVVNAVVGLMLASFALLGWELWRKRGRRRLLVVLTGALSVALLALAVLRPVRVSSRDALVGARVVVLVDASRSIDLPGLSGTRRETTAMALTELAKRKDEVRETMASFGDDVVFLLGDAAEGGELRPDAAFDVRPVGRSDLETALEAVADLAGEPPTALVVISDGRLDRPTEEGTGQAVVAALGHLKIPVHTVAVATAAPPDASIRSVSVAGAAVAHQPLTLRIEVACTGGLDCGAIPVTVKELQEQGEAPVRASGVATIVDGVAELELSATIHRAGARILEVSLDAPDGQAIEANDQRFIAINVARDRVRVLHVAGRPTYDVRALRMWLKSDASVDLVAFFILRSDEDNVVAPSSELALIPFPVDELFTDHLPSFDAVVLQDFDAGEYGLSRHLSNLRRYVEKGGGVIMVGGPDSFAAGSYGATAFEDVLPVVLSRARDRVSVDLDTFVPSFTDAGRVAPVLGPLRDLIGEALPQMPGTNVVGDARSTAHVLWTHPRLRTEAGEPMPVLSVGEYGAGRTIALTIDSSHRLLFSTYAADVAAGRAHEAFWDAMLGWLMRDPRFESAVVDVAGTCIAGLPTHLRVRPLPGTTGTVSVTVRQMGSGAVAFTGTAALGEDPKGTLIDVGVLDRGGYTATVEISHGDAEAPPTQREFACEVGGAEWADVRPDPDRLKRIAEATGGAFALAPDAAGLPLPKSTRVASERRVIPALPPWVWTLAAALMLGAHWVIRRRSGLS